MTQGVLSFQYEEEKCLEWKRMGSTRWVSPQAKFPLTKKFSENGTWTVESVGFSDRTGNYTYIYNATLQTMTMKLGKKRSDTKVNINKAAHKKATLSRQDKVL